MQCRRDFITGMDSLSLCLLPMFWDTCPWSALNWAPSTWVMSLIKKVIKSEFHHIKHHAMHVIDSAYSPKLSFCSKHCRLSMSYCLLTSKCSTYLRLCTFCPYFTAKPSFLKPQLMLPSSSVPHARNAVINKMGYLESATGNHPGILVEVATSASRRLAGASLTLPSSHLCQTWQKLWVLTTFTKSSFFLYRIGINISNLFYLLT